MPLWSQITVTGLITDENGVPLPGASVIEKGTQNGVSADFDGLYSIEISEESSLDFSFIGYGTKSVLVGSQTEINISPQK